MRKKETRVCSSSTRTRERELQGLREKRKKGIVGPIGFRKKKHQRALRSSRKRFRAGNSKGQSIRRQCARQDDKLTLPRPAEAPPRPARASGTISESSSTNDDRGRLFCVSTRKSLHSPLLFPLSFISHASFQFQPWLSLARSRESNDVRQVSLACACSKSLERLGNVLDEAPPSRSPSKKKNTQPLPCSSYTTTTTTSSSAPAQQQLGSSRLLSWKLSLT